MVLNKHFKANFPILRVAALFTLLICYTYIATKTHLEYGTFLFSSVIPGRLESNIQVDKQIQHYDLTNATVFITGIAGFIGYSVASHLAQQNVKQIVGIDNFNDYYDPALKYKRADMLSRLDQVTVLRGDVCNASLLEHLFTEYTFTHVIHLAAQAGVRHSLKRPLDYIRANVECFVTLFEEIRRVKSNDKPVPHVIYASSSSVYGSNEKIPFEERDRVDQPASLYGATKRMNELMAYVYYHIFGIPSIGLRFFTVYGPWGRPDMAPFVFTDKIERGEKITVYNHGDMRRDFTYIDDIVDGITRASQLKKLSSPIVLNFGNERPESVLTLIKIIEERLQRTANLTNEESIVDLPLTYASTDAAKRLLGFEAKIRLEDGMNRFIDWYLLNSQTRFLCASECADSKRCLPTFFDTAVPQSTTMTDGCEIVVYAVYLGTAEGVLYEPVHELRNNDQSASCYVAFTSRQMKTQKPNSKWRQISLNETNLLQWDSRQISRVLKLTPGRFFSPTVKWAIYLDAKYQLVGEPRAIVHMSRDLTRDKSAVLVTVRHPLSNSSFDEGLQIAKAKRKIKGLTYSMWQMEHQLNIYKSMGEVDNVTMANEIHGAFLIHDLKSDSGKRYRCAWSQEYFSGADRDQISFPWVLAKQAKQIGIDLHPGQEWCQITRDPGSYVRILPHSFLDQNTKYGK